MNEDIIYLNTNQVITINAYVIQLFSPMEQVGVKDSTMLDSAINRPKHSAFGTDAYPTVFDKAGAIFESLAKNHPFFNGNKRTALVSLIMFLKINHYRWLMNNQEEQDFVVDVVNHLYSFNEMVQVIERNSKRM